jgi:phosphoenolpyruvate-protein phosphotransferase
METYEIEGHQVQEELRRLDRALKVVVEDLRVSTQRIEGEADDKLAAIFEAHQSMLQDAELLREVHALIEEEWICAAQAVSRVFRRWERRFRELKQEAHRRHAADVADLRQRLLREMAGIAQTPLEKMPPGRVLVARRLLPSDTVALPRRQVVGIILEVGGPGSHAALLAEAMGIPTVTHIPQATDRISEGDLVMVDGLHGEIVVNPGKVTVALCREAMRHEQVRSSQALHLALQPARTADGIGIEVLANVSCREDVLAAVENGADGVGLYRIEQYYLARKTPPSVGDLLGELTEVFAPMRGRPVTVRLLDLGGDKPVPFLKLPPEENPFLGQRGVRFLLRYPDLLDTQLRALCEFSKHQDLRILVPMLTLAEEMAFIRSQLVRVSCGQKLPILGAMIETPAAALSVPEITSQADFLSVGTNDLTQYTMAAGRENPLVNDYFREDHPAVLRLLGIILEEAGQTPVALCGELARQTESLPVLLRLGLRTLSVAPPLVPAVKQAIRQVTL